jgi:hypothetical protein
VSVVLTVKLRADGAIESVAVLGEAPGSMTECLKAVVLGARFDAPDAGSATVTIPVTFIPQS